MRTKLIALGRSHRKIIAPISVGVSHKYNRLPRQTHLFVTLNREPCVRHIGLFDWSEKNIDVPTRLGINSGRSPDEHVTEAIAVYVTADGHRVARPFTLPKTNNDGFSLCERPPTSIPIGTILVNSIPRRVRSVRMDNRVGIVTISLFQCPTIVVTILRMCAIEVVLVALIAPAAADGTQAQAQEDGAPYDESFTSEDVHR